MEFPNWFIPRVGSFTAHLSHLVGQPNLQFLQIGAYTGDASVWLLDNILTGEGSRLIDVDTWAGTENEQIHASLDWSEAWDLYRSRMRHRSAVPYRMTSDQFFDFVEPKGQFDFVYVDGDHRSDQVWRDALNADAAVKIGGVIAFDDYLWNAGHNDVPRVAIDRFLGDHGSRYELLEHGFQVWLRKVSERLGPVRQGRDRDGDSTVAIRRGRTDPRQPRHVPGLRGADMKICVYAICLDERENIDAWAESAKDADYILLADTGSTDGTPGRARELGVNVIDVRVIPWRFDVARNAALAAIPEAIDYCLVLDLDERLQPGWREALEAVPAEVTRPLFDYVWSWNPDGTPNVRFYRDLCHSRRGYTWRRPVHEKLVRYGSGPEIQQVVPGLAVHQFHSMKETRTNYLPLLAIACDEDPTDAQAAFWYARDLMYDGQNTEAIEEFRRFLTIPGAWNVERSWAMRYLAALIPQQRSDYLLAATTEAPERREPWMELAEFHYAGEEWAQAIMAAEHALAITHNPVDYLTESSVWGDRPQEIIRKARQWLKIEENL